jgi:anthranilate phosphoribosyltransferase
MPLDDFPLIRKLMAREDLTRAEARALVRSLLESDALGYELLAFSVASQTKGETAQEMLGFLDAMADLTGPYDLDVSGDLTDIASAGASGLRKLNVSTLSALVVGEPELPVAKQSFFRVTGMIGSADVAAAVGLAVPGATLPQIERALKTVGVAFYSPLFVSPELKNLVGFGMMLAAKGVGVPTPFHMLAPIFTPLRLRYRMFGLNRLNSFELLVELFRDLGYESAFCVRGEDGLDEASLAAPTRVRGFRRGEEIDLLLTPEAVGLKTVPQETIQPVSAEESVGDFLRIVHGAERGPKRDLIALNSGLALYMTGHAESIAAGIALAIRRLESGEVAGKLAALVELMGDVAVLERARREALTGS